ncbi:hypothetical protein BH23CHL7_BH23CHL7_06750 [soil metagenome]
MRNVLFVCEHGAAKSVVAAALFRDRVGRSGGTTTATARGINPDDAIPPTVLTGLRCRGLEPGDSVPQRVSVQDLAGADLVVTFALDLAHQPATTRRERWDDIPSVSSDFDAAFEAISARVDALLADAAER